MLRGHIRDSFNSNRLYYLIKNIYNLYPDIKIYIHTWNVVANNLSWRNITPNNKEINEDIIKIYFSDLTHLIKHVIIDDDSRIELVGKLTGYVSKSTMPIRGWKNYWYGKYRIIDYINKDETIDNNELIINLRFDILNNSNSLVEKKIIDFINSIVNNKNFYNIIFFSNNDKHYGIDNLYIGYKQSMYQLIKKFVFELDDIIINNKDTINQEHLVMFVCSKLFDN